MSDNATPKILLTLKTNDLPDTSDRNASDSYTSPTPIASDGLSTKMLEYVSEEGDAKGEGVVRKKLSRLLQGKEEEWTAVASKTGPLQLLDLPMDILKDIVKEVTHTNDLTSLALTHSALHALAIPHIYSRFDIVWPDGNSTNDSRSGVDALTYGLATLVFGAHNFPAKMRRRIGNNYPQHTRKFSLGNGRPDWVQEYMITKESGKMLGTLVALAVTRMTSLEQFIWDMPTGVLRDVWLSLSSLEDRAPSGDCRLEKVLVRWHDNSVDQAPASAGSFPGPTILPGAPTSSVGIIYDPHAIPPAPLPLPALSGQLNESQIDLNRNRVEYPTFSVLPPLKSLSVLDIDEISYLDEMSLSIAKSQSKLRELRVGIAKKAQWKDFVMAWDGPGLQQVDDIANLSHGPSSSIGEKRLGGVLGILLGRIFDLRKKRKPSPHGDCVPTTTVDEDVAKSEVKDPTIEEVDAALFLPNGTSGTTPHNLSEPVEHVSTAPQGVATDLSSTLEAGLAAVSLSPTKKSIITRTNFKFGDKEECERQKQAFIEKQQREIRNSMLRLETLELERVPLSIAVLQKAFDWPILTSLTLLDCSYHEQFWRMLRRQFQPRSHGNGLGSLCPTSVVPDYQLNIRKVHTDHVSLALISFLKETLAPNTLEVLFLQDRKRVTTTPAVTIEQIYKGPLKRHRRSLRKLLIDSSDKIPKGPGSSSDSTRWRTWMVTHEVLTFITSGSMSNLRELSIAMDYKDWHFFLRRLPQIPTLRSLNIPFIADHVTPSYDPKELAMQIVDMIFLRPEIELCYLGISNKCFEVLENRHDDHSHNGAEAAGASHGGGDGSDDEDEHDVDDTTDDDGDDEEEDEEEEDDDGTATEAVEAVGSGYDNGSDPDDSDDESSSSSLEDRSKLSLRLREILYYDDKVAIFRARHMKL